MHDDTPTRPGEPGAKPDDQVVAERVQPPGAARGPERARVRDTFVRLPGSDQTVPATEAQHAELASVEADTVVMDRSGAEHIRVAQLTMERSGAKSIEADSAHLERSGVVALGADSAVLEHSSAVQVVAEQAQLSHSTAVFVTAQHATLEQSRVVVFAGSAEGDVRPLLTARGAAILAGGLALAGLLVALLGRGRASD